MLTNRELDSEAGYRFVDGQIVYTADQAMTAQTSYALYVYVMLERRLYVHAVDEEGNRLFANSQAYLKDVAQRVSISRSSAYRYIKAIKLAQDVAGFGVEDIGDIGIAALSNVGDFVMTNRRGDVLGLKGEPDIAPDEAKALIKEAFYAQHTASPNERSGTDMLKPLLAPSSPVIASYQDEHENWMWTFQFYEQSEDYSQIHFYTGRILIAYTDDNGFIIRFTGDEHMPSEKRRMLMDYFTRRLIGGQNVNRTNSRAA